MDDGKRFYSDGRCSGVCSSVKREEVWRRGRGGSKLSLSGGIRMTGSAVQAVDVV